MDFRDTKLWFLFQEVFTKQTHGEGCWTLLNGRFNSELLHRPASIEFCVGLKHKQPYMTNVISLLYTSTSTSPDNNSVSLWYQYNSASLE